MIGEFVLRLLSTEYSSNQPSTSGHKVVLSVAVFRQHNIIAGEASQFFVGAAWPSTDLALECITVHPTIATDVLKAKDGARLRVNKLETNEIQRAKHLYLSEVYSATSSNVWTSERATTGENSQEGTTVNMKYVWKGRAVYLKWEGRSRTFLVTRGKARNKNLEGHLQTLSLSNSAMMEGEPVWVIGWDCIIEILPASQIPEGTVHAVIEKPIPSTPYESVGGLSRQISQIRDLIEIPLTRPSLFSHFHLKPPKGLLLHGPPGTGKTHLARAIAQSTNSNFIVVNGPELGSAYHGESEKRLREVFESAQKSAPCIVVLDEVDAMCPRRDDGGDGGEVAKRVVATLLTILDGMEAQEDSDQPKGRVVVVATTNRPNAIDPALRRPGRFDKEVEI
ncbi:3966_t:CDS:2, partial [Acaulospora colombiana]